MHAGDHILVMSNGGFGGGSRQAVIGAWCKTGDCMNKRVTLAITGASGACYGVRLLECLLGAGCQVYLLLSSAARVVLTTELKSVARRAAECAAYLCQRFNADAGQLLVSERMDWFRLWHPVRLRPNRWWWSPALWERSAPSLTGHLIT